MTGLVKAGLSVGKEFLANTVADKLGNKDSTSIETPSTTIDVDESPTIDMSDNYEATSYDSNEDDPSFVDIDIPDTEQLELENTDVVDTPNDIPDVTPIDEVELPGEQEATEDETTPVDIEPTQTTSGDLNTDTSAPLTGNTTNGSFNVGIPIGSSFMPSIENTNSPVELPQIQQPEAQPDVNTIPSIDTTVSSDPNELVQAMYDGDPVKTEEYIEQNPEESIDILKDGTDIDTEARQVIDGNPHNVEVKDEAVEEALKEPGAFINSNWTASMGENPLPYGERPNLHRGDKAIDRMQERIDKLNEVKDEDFLGPDEYIDENGEIKVDPNWKPVAEELDVPEEEIEQFQEDLNTIIDNPEEVDNVEELDNKLGKAKPETAEEAKALQRLRLRIRNYKTATGSGQYIDNTEPYTDNEVLKTGIGPSVGVGNLMRASGNVSGGRMDKVGHDELHSRKPAAMGTTPNVTGVVEDNFGTATKMKSNVNAPKSSTVTRTNGALATSSGGLMSTRKKSGEFKSDKIKLASGESRSNKKGISPEDLNVADILVNRLKMMLSKMSPLVRKQLGFNPVSYQYKGTSIDKLPPEVVNKLIEVIEENGMAQ